MQDQDRYIWAAKMADKSLVFQRRTDPKTGEEQITQYEDLDRTQIRVFSLLDKHNEMRPRVRLNFDGDGEKLVWTRRVQMIPGGGRVMFHIVGKKGRYIMAVNPQGESIVMDNFSEDDVLFNPTSEFKRVNEDE